MDTVEPYNDGRESPPRCKGSGSVRPLHRKSLERNPKRLSNKHEDMEVKRHSISRKSSKEKYNSHLGSELEDNECLTNEKHSRQWRVPDSGTLRNLSADSYGKGRGRQDKELRVIHLVNDPFREALYYWTYCLARTLSHYDDKRGGTFQNGPRIYRSKMMSQIFDSFDPISIIGFLSDFKLVYDTNRVQGGDALWLLPFFLTHPTAVVHNVGIALRSKSHKR